MHNVTRLLLSATFHVLFFFSASAQLKIYCLDVNQGDATLVIAPNRQSLLIDAGLKKDADEILEVLEREGIDSIDYAVLTHFDSDHRGGFSLLKEKRIAIKHSVFDHGGKPPKAYSKDVGKRIAIKPGHTFPMGQQVSVTCLAAKRKTIDGTLAVRSSASNYGENQNSVALLIQYEGFDFFIAGDLTTNVEEALVDDGAVPDVDIYHVSHHGSTTSSAEEFIRELSPEVSIVSNGTKHNHPTQPVIDLLQEYDSEIYQTNKNTSTRQWSVPIKNLPAKYIGDLDPVQDRGTILIHVQNGRYTISLERKGYKGGETYLIDVTR